MNQAQTHQRTVLPKSPLRPYHTQRSLSPSATSNSHVLLTPPSSLLSAWLLARQTADTPVLWSCEFSSSSCCVRLHPPQSCPSGGSPPLSRPQLEVAPSTSGQPLPSIQSLAHLESGHSYQRLISDATRQPRCLCLPPCLHFWVFPCSIPLHNCKVFFTV